MLLRTNNSKYRDWKQNSRRVQAHARRQKQLLNAGKFNPSEQAGAKFSDLSSLLLCNSQRRRRRAFSQSTWINHSIKSETYVTNSTFSQFSDISFFKVPFLEKKHRFSIRIFLFLLQSTKFVKFLKGLVRIGSCIRATLDWAVSGAGKSSLFIYKCCIYTFLLYSGAHQSHYRV